MGVDRNQLNGIETSFHTRQDRNSALVGGGNITWLSGNVSWDVALEVRLPGATNPATVSDPGGGVSLTSGQCMYVELDRAVGGAVTPQVVEMTDDLLLADDIYVLAYHGPGARLHWRDGTVQGDDQTVQLGQSSPGVDRSTVISDGSADVLVGFDYVMESGQLLVVVGGVVQEEGLHYTEAAGSPGEVTFEDDFVPSVNERIVFLNLNGSQGPSGAATTLQGAYDEAVPTVNVADDNPISLRGSSNKQLQQWGTSGTPDQAYVLGSGAAKFRSLLLGTRNEMVIVDNRWVLYDTVTERAVLVDPAEGFRFGTYDGSTWAPDDAASDGAVRMAFYEVVLDSAAPTQVVLDPEVAANFKGAAISAYNITQGQWYCADIAVPQQAGNQLHLIFDSAGGMLLVSGTYSGNSPVGFSFGGNSARIVVFY